VNLGTFSGPPGPNRCTSSTGFSIVPACNRLIERREDHETHHLCGTARLPVPVGCCLRAGLPGETDQPARGLSGGRSTDLSMRALAAEAAKILKQPIVVSNVVGAAGTLVLAG